MQPEVDPGLADHRIGYALEPVGVERGGVADRLRLDVRMKVEHPPARPFAPQRLVGAALGFGRHDAQAEALHALDHLAAQAAHADLRAVAHVVEHQHHAARSEAAEIGVAFDQRDGQAVARAGDRRRDARRAAADHHQIGAAHDRDPALGLDDRIGVGHGKLLAACVGKTEGAAPLSLPPCGGGPGRGVAPRCLKESFTRSLDSFVRPPSLTLPHKGEGIRGARNLHHPVCDTFHFRQMRSSQEIRPKNAAENTEPTTIVA